MTNINVYDPEKCKGCDYKQYPDMCEVNMCSNYMMDIHAVTGNAMTKLVFFMIDKSAEAKKKQSMDDAAQQ